MTMEGFGRIPWQGKSTVSRLQPYLRDPLLKACCLLVLEQWCSTLQDAQMAQPSMQSHVIWPTGLEKTGSKGGAINIAPLSHHQISGVLGSPWGQMTWPCKHHCSRVLEAIQIAISKNLQCWRKSRAENFSEKSKCAWWFHCSCKPLQLKNSRHQNKTIAIVVHDQSIQGIFAEVGIFLAAEEKENLIQTPKQICSQSKSYWEHISVISLISLAWTRINCLFHWHLEALVKVFIAHKRHNFLHHASH